MNPVDISRELSRDTGTLSFSPPVHQVYNPLDYAWPAHKQYLLKYASNPREVLLLGMNPGPWGMAQSGVPFGDVAMVRDWLGIEAKIARPAVEHPKRPILGFDCARSEVSGARLWGWARARFGTPERFFARFYVHNYCPLCFMEVSGRNFTPDKLPREEQAALFAACDRALVRLVEHLQPSFLVGVGVFAETRFKTVFPGGDYRIGRIPHPSPASPAANRDWAGGVESALQAIGITL